MKYRHHLPQLNGQMMLTDGGLETTLIFHDGIDLPLFAAFKAFDTDAGSAAMDRYMRLYAELAVAQGCGFVLDTPTWRASAKWAAELGLSADELKEVHREAIAYLQALRAEYETPSSPFVINGVIGPQDDGYQPAQTLTPAEALEYHAQQVTWFADMGADMASAMTMTYAEEAIGITRAAQSAELPIAISFTVETDGCLPSGQALSDAIKQVDVEAAGGPAFFMVNCAHPDHFREVLFGGTTWQNRIYGVRANASRMSHAELDACDTLDDGDPKELGALYRDLAHLLPNLTVIGGCCGTDHRHVAEMTGALRTL